MIENVKEEPDFPYIHVLNEILGITKGRKCD